VVLGEIVAKDPASLNDFEIAFLKSRESYLDGKERQKFSSLLSPVKVQAPVKVIKK
jgi:hypothetical protein